MTDATTTASPTERDDFAEERVRAKASGVVLGGSTSSRVKTSGLVALFTLTAFVGAALLFVVQPLIARMLLPAYGGSATVWSTSSLFFQVLLLLGYLYSHVATRRLGSRWQPPVHLLVLLAPLVVLPVALPADAVPDIETSPVLWLLRTLTLLIGLPFVVISTSGPLLQRWYSWSGGPRADDPYFLFAASNVGSFVGLLAYPFVVEPWLTVDQQRIAWSTGFVLFALLTAACAVVTRTRTRVQGAAAIPTSPIDGAAGAELALKVKTKADGGRTSRRRLVRWTALSFLPSALMLAVTSHISTDVAAIPLLWVVPLAIYLATFVLAFARTSRAISPGVDRWAVVATLVAAATYPLKGTAPVWIVIPVLLALLALVAFAAHARLAADRPDVDRLTGFYLATSIGGALGGVLNGLLAPMLFDRVWEFPLLLAVVPFLLGRTDTTTSRIGAYASRHWVAFTIVALGFVLVLRAPTFAALLDQGSIVLIGSLLLVGFGGWALSRTGRWLAALALSLFMATCVIGDGRGVVDRDRTFYGSYRVMSQDGGHLFVHGTTVHGSQGQGVRRGEPTTYYARSGPLGDVFAQSGFSDVAAVGMGVGTVAAYGVQGQQFTFVEIDSAVVDIAKNPKFFTYLEDSKANVNVKVGDGRQTLEESPDASLDLIILDAFSSDSIPVHLLTTDAMRVYASKLRPGGLLMVHISNRVFDLRPVVRGAANELGWEAALGSKGEAHDSATASEWVALSADAARIAALRSKDGWEALPLPSITWTDDYSSVLSVLR
ncbi:hypothetical protein N802_18515 [Knoellia sinensis KCTC 19936]|uniref:Spermidine synthase n=1 Tax=Knoellia sinensis KCTC 19936 TaxID=1385520 RepID=A0A0A0J6E9_9MICO|nr:fused MFS/spermidine synthase [Knoellia sinensis]KGN32359.1 hypothetical protein N802_18515 [Knoellia sinensis KCTC 19936]